MSSGMEWGTAERNEMEWNGVYSGVEWDELEWCGMEWNGVEWGGVRWGGVECGWLGWSAVE